MAFDNSYTAVTGGTLSAGQWNTGVRDNFTAVWKGTTAGDIDYYTSATEKSRLGITPGGVLYGGAAAPVWTALGAYGSIFYNPSSGVPAWLGRGSGYQALLMSSGGVLPEWAASLQSLMTAQGDIVYASAANTPAKLAKGAAGEKLVSNGTIPVYTDDDISLQVALGNSVDAIPAVSTAMGSLQVPCNCVVEGWTIFAPLESGSIVVDVWAESYAGIPSTSGNSIAGTEKPTISSAQKGQDLSLSTWTTSLTKGDWLTFAVNSCSGITLVTLAIHCRVTAVS